jgi:hypothetical protein
MNNLYKINMYENVVLRTYCLLVWSEDNKHLALSLSLAVT